MNYIGIDCHIATMDFTVVNEKGIVSKKGKVKTGEKEFMEFVKSVSKPRKVFIEECDLAAWAVEKCHAHGEDIVVTDPKQNRWISKADEKDDSIDATKLAQLARGGYVKEIYHPVGDRRRFKELVLSYHDIVKSETRIKNKLKAKFRQNGIACTGDTVYSKKHRTEWKKKLPKNKILGFIVESLWTQLDQATSVKEETKRQMRLYSKQYPEIKRFMEVPGIGLIHASTFSAIIETPHRFSNKKKVWKYAGLGLSKRSSSDKVYSFGLSTEYNRLLKNTAKQATESAVMARDNQFRRQYLRLTLVQVIPSHRAKLTVGRSIIATLYGIWRHDVDYDPSIAIRREERLKEVSVAPSH